MAKNELYRIRSDWLYLYTSELAEGIVGWTFDDEVAAAEWAGWVVIFPGVYAYDVEIFFASAAILQILSFFRHLSEANGAISIVFKVDLLTILLAASHATLQPLSKLLIKRLISCC